METSRSGEGPTNLIELRQERARGTSLAPTAAEASGSTDPQLRPTSTPDLANFDQVTAHKLCELTGFERRTTEARNALGAVSDGGAQDPLAVPRGQVERRYLRDMTAAAKGGSCAPCTSLRASSEIAMPLAMTCPCLRGFGDSVPHVSKFSQEKVNS